MKKKQKQRQRFKFTIPLVFILLLIVPAIFLIRINGEFDYSPPTYNGLSVDFVCKNDLKTSLITLQLGKREQHINCSINIDDWDKVKNSCDSITIYFPFRINNPKYANSIDIDSALKSVSSNKEMIEKIDKSKENIPLENLRIDRFSNNSLIKIDCNKDKWFPGNVEFFWANGLKRIAFEKFKLHLPLNYMSNAYSPRKYIDKYLITLTGPPSYKLTNSIPEKNAYSKVGEFLFYQFEMDTKNELLELEFEDNNLKNKKNNLNIFLTTLFGIGLGLMIEEIYSYFKSKEIKL